MNGRLTANRLAAANIRRHKGQYVTILIGIVLSMVFSSSAVFFLFSLKTSVREMNRQAYGSQDGILFNADAKLADDLLAEGIVSGYGAGHIIGYAYTDAENADMGTAVGWLEPAALELANVQVEDGRLPEAENEIAVESTALARLGLEPAVGGTVKLTVEPQDGSGTLPDRAEETAYTLVGVLSDKRANIERMYGSDERDPLPAAFVSAGAQTAPGGKESLYFYYAHDGLRSNEFYDRLYEQSGVSDETRAVEIGAATAWGSESTYRLSQSVHFLALIAVVLTAASALAVINSFNSNIRGRKKQIGLYRAVGATKRQVRLIFARETVFIGAVTLPASVALSYFIVKGAAGFLGDGFTLTPSWQALLLSSAAGLASVTLASMIAVRASSRITPMQAVRNTEMIRRLRNKKTVSQKQFTLPKLFAKRSLALHTGLRALIGILLSLTIIITAFGFTLLKTERGYADSAESYDYRVSVYGGMWQNGLITSGTGAGLTQNDRKKMADIPYVSSTSGMKSARINLVTDKFTDYLLAVGADSLDGSVFNGLWSEDEPDPPTAENYFDRLTSGYTEDYLAIKQRFGIEGELFPISVVSFDDDEIKRLCPEADLAALSDGTGVLLSAPEKVGYYFKPYRDGGYMTRLDQDEAVSGSLTYALTARSDFRAGDTLRLDSLTMPDETARRYYDSDLADILPSVSSSESSVRIDAIISRQKTDIGAFDISGSPALITTHAGLEKLIPGVRYNTVSMKLGGQVNSAIDDDMTNILKDYELKYTDQMTGCYVESVFAEKRDMRSDLTRTAIGMGAILALFFTIAGSVVTNSLTCRIRDSKREIGTMRAVGAASRDINAAYFRQLLSMFAPGSAVGFGAYAAGFAAVRLLGRSADSLPDALSFLSEWADIPFSPWEALAAVAALLLICALRLRFAVKREMDRSITENIREL